ncbi:MAG: hypothetical protein AMR96_02920 [Candidatus Adiutrix intracellularis]|jgi:hypothetical protein|nr:MAG: hypothetical protein AMR96_02920 [Candidatus Adiutrix intracellularis]MDR2826741.1 hypothetical protein [Candidatus Adiutrix intracellularis]
MNESFKKTDLDLISTNLNTEIEAIFEKADNLLALDTVTQLSPLTLRVRKEPESSESPIAPPTAYAPTEKFLEIN